MAKLSSQFYATPAELADFVRGVLRRYRVSAGLVRKHPFRIDPVEPGADLTDDAVGIADWVVFAVEPIEGEVTSAKALETTVPDALTLEVGRLDEHGLRQSWLRAMGDNEAAMKLWARVARDLRTITYAGVTAVDPATGVRGPASRTVRCTPGARELDARGVRILPAAGTTSLRLTDPP